MRYNTYKIMANRISLIFCKLGIISGIKKHTSVQANFKRVSDVDILINHPVCSMISDICDICRLVTVDGRTPASHYGSSMQIYDRFRKLFRTCSLSLPLFLPTRLACSRLLMRRASSETFRCILENRVT